jgi:hypothetical protein
LTIYCQRMCCFRIQLSKSFYNTRYPCPLP